MNDSEPVRVEFVCVPSRLPPWPLKRWVWRPAWLGSSLEWPEPTEAHAEEVLAMNPALAGWGEPL